MFRVIAILFSLTVLVSCNSGIKNQEAAGQSDTTDIKGRFGEKISGKDAISGQQLMALLQENDSVWVTLQSEIVANCQSSGCWMDLDLGDGNLAKVTFKDYAFFIPLDSKGKSAIVEGFAKKELIPVDLLKHYAEDEGRPQEEIDAITEPELTYVFEAIGVIIEE